MLKRDIADQLYSIAVRRIKRQRPNINLNNDQLTAIWFSIYGILQSEGEKAAREYVENAKINI